MMRERDHITNGVTAVWRCRVLRAGGSARRASAVCCALAVWVAMATAGWGRAGAQATSCGITEITFTSGAENRDPSVSGDGTRIAFSSTSNLTNQNADRNQEIFLYDAAAGTITQVTDTVEGGNADPSISADGMRIAFASIANVTGQNADGNFEVFLYDTAAGTITQVTDTTEGGNAGPSVSGDGARIAFVSISNLTNQNADGSAEIFLYDATAGTFTQVTDTTAFFVNESPSISGDGSRIAFRSNRFAAGNLDGNSEIFLYDAATKALTQVTDTVGSVNASPSISGDGRRIAFESDSFAGSNADGNREIFLYDATTSGIYQITDTTDTPGVLGNQFPSISGDGTRIAFESTHDLTGQNADGNEEVFLYDAEAGTFTQVTNTAAGLLFESAISGDGKRIAFASNRFANLGNADGNFEIFIAGCLSPEPPSSADLLVSLGVDKSSVKQGDLLTYTVTVLNYGPDTARNIIVNDALSSGATFVGARANRGTFTAPPANQTGTVTWNVGDMSSGDRQAAQIIVTVMLRGKGAITNTATVGSVTADPNPANNTASIATTVGSGGGGNGKK